MGRSSGHARSYAVLAITVPEANSALLAHVKIARATECFREAPAYVTSVTAVAAARSAARAAAAARAAYRAANRLGCPRHGSQYGGF